MTVSSNRFHLLSITLMFVTVVTHLAADELRDPADLPVPISPRYANEESLEALETGPVKPLPYRGLEDDPVTPLGQSTVSQFVTYIEDVESCDILERPGIPVGWFANLELTAANSRVSNRMQSDPLAAFPNPISVPSASLDWNVMPKVTLGYRLAEGMGELSVGYRYLRTEGDSANVSSRLQQQILDLEYSLSDLFPNDLCTVPRQLRITGGVRVAAIDYKTTASGGNILSQSAVNTLYGAGPRFAAETLYPLASSRWTLFGKLDTSAVIGTDRQSFGQTTIGPGGTSASVSNTSATASPVLGFRTGTHWLPEWGGGNVKMSAGYQWERWYYLGTNTSSFNELTIQGPYLQGEVAF